MNFRSLVRDLPGYSTALRVAVENLKKKRRYNTASGFRL
jgi:hypothetical protein